MPLSFKVNNGKVTLEMPLPKEGDLTENTAEGMLVHLDGITHLVVVDSVSSTPRAILERLLENNQYGISSYPAFGVSCFESNTGKASFCVWVNAVNTIFDETACGSGTSSIGVALAMSQRNSLSQDVIQPSGQVIRTIADFDLSQSKVVSSSIAGSVDVLFDGEFVTG